LEAITKSEIDKPNIILMDIQLSGSLNGIEAAEIIKYKHNIPVIFLTDRTNEHFLPQSKYSANHLAIKKPVDILQLSELIKQIQNEIIVPANSSTSRQSPYTL
jgi:CheY-like chemotaxis protein